MSVSQLPFAMAGQFYRGNLHTHSTRSDGDLSPEAVCAFYKRMGYNFLSITDHFMDQFSYPITDCRAYETDSFVTLAGAELHAGKTSIGEIWHILANGLPYDFAPNADGETGTQIAQRAMDAGAFVTCAHPNWYSLPESDVIALGNVHAIETINGISEDHNDRIDSWYMLDTMLSQGRRYFALTTDDAHFTPRHSDRLKAWTWVKSESLTAESILDALKRGAYYSSTGAEIHHVEVRESTVYIQCSAVESIFITGIGARSVYKHAKGMIEAELELKRLGDSPFCRVTVRNSRGDKAWTNPIWFR
jgi:histidinol phosphatase-like PHP family hydrolase